MIPIMKIRNGFVTNSSSTNYIIMSKDKLTPEKIVELLGVKKDSVLYDEVYSLACTLLDSRGYLIHSDEEDTIEVQIEKIFGLVTKKEYEKAMKEKKYVYYGTVSTENGAIESSFALDCGKIKKNGVIIDFSEWGY